MGLSINRYFDKKSSNHHLEDSMSKYSSKSVNSYGNCNDSSYGKHRRNCSPTNGSNSRSRSGSPDNWSPNRSVYPNKSSYSRNKDRDRDRDGRDRERDKYYDKKKVMNCRSSRSRSPIEPKQSYNKSVNNHSSHDMNNDNKSSVNRNHSSKSMSDWSEQMSSSGKKYYYNHKTSVSQWEKPKEWLEIERRHSTKSDRHSSHSFRDNSRDKSCVTSSNSKQYVHDLSSGHRNDSKDNSRTKISGSASTGSNSNSSIRSHSRRDDDLRPSTDRSNNDSKRLTETKNSLNSVNCVKRVVSESLKSPSVASNESSNTNSLYNKTNHSFVVNNSQTNDLIRTQTQTNASNINNNINNNNYNNNNSVVSNNTSGNTSSAQQLLSQLSQQLSPTQTQALQKIIVSSSQGTADLSMNFPEETLRALQQALQSLSAKASDTKSHSTQPSRHRTLSSPRSSVACASSESPVSTSGHHHRHHHMHHNQHHYHSQQTHHQSADGIRHELDLLISRANKSPASEKSGISSTRHDSPPSSVTNISSAISSASLKPSVPTLTPSLANFFREDLVSHVTGWQAEHAEKQANHYSNQSHDIGSHQCTRVSAELKMARSLVRLTEIQSTLQEQRILFATQQIKNVEEWKGQNATHSSYHS